MTVITKKKTGRPTDYTHELAHEICDAIASSSKGIKKLCKENSHWPNPDTIFSWLMQHKEFSDLYARAKQHQVESLVDDVLEIADDTSNDYTVREDGKLVVDHVHIQRAKLKIDTRKWIAAKLCPRLYGDRLTDQPPMETLLEKLIDKL
jgi:hypothetical protein